MVCVRSGFWPAEQGMGGSPVWWRGLMTDWLNPLWLLFILIHTASQKFNPLVRREVSNCIYFIYLFIKLQGMHKVMFPLVWGDRAAGYCFLAHGSSLLSASTKELFFSRLLQSGLTTSIVLLCLEPSSLCFVWFSSHPLSPGLLCKTVLRVMSVSLPIRSPQLKFLSVCLSFGQWLVQCFRMEITVSLQFS